MTEEFHLALAQERHDNPIDHEVLEGLAEHARELHEDAAREEPK